MVHKAAEAARRVQLDLRTASELHNKLSVHLASLDSQMKEINSNLEHITREEQHLQQEIANLENQLKAHRDNPKDFGDSLAESLLVGFSGTRIALSDISAKSNVSEMISHLKIKRDMLRSNFPNKNTLVKQLDDLKANIFFISRGVVILMDKTILNEVGLSTSYSVKLGDKAAHPSEFLELARDAIDSIHGGDEKKKGSLYKLIDLLSLQNPQHEIPFAFEDKWLRRPSSSLSKKRSYAVSHESESVGYGSEAGHASGINHSGDISAAGSDLGPLYARISQTRASSSSNRPTSTRGGQ